MHICTIYTKMRVRKTLFYLKNDLIRLKKKQLSKEDVIKKLNLLSNIYRKYDFSTEDLEIKKSLEDFWLDYIKEDTNA